MLDVYASMGMNLDALYMEIMSGERFMMSLEEEAGEGIYTIEGNVISLDIDGDVLTGTIDGYLLTFDIDDGIMGYRWDPLFVPPVIGGSGADDAPWSNPNLQVFDPGDHIITGKTYFRFIPPQSGTWEFYTTSDYGNDPMLAIYDNFGNLIAVNDDAGDSLDSFISLFVTESIVVEVDFYSGTVTTLTISPEGGEGPTIIITYGGTPFSTLLGKTIDEVIGALGAPESMGQDGEDVVVQLFYQGSCLWIEDGRFVYLENYEPGVFEVGGGSLDKNSSALIGLLGNPSVDGWGEGAYGAENAYYMGYELPGYYLYLEFNSPDEPPYMMLMGQP